MRNRYQATVVAVTCALALLPDLGWTEDAAKPAPTAEQVFVVDLAVGNGRRTFDVKPGNFIVRFLHRAPNGIYKFDSTTETLLLPSLEPPAAGKTAEVAPPPSCSDECAKTTLNDNLRCATTALMAPDLRESDTPAAQAAVETLLSCPAIDSCLAETRQEARAALARTTLDVPVQVDDGQEVAMVLSRTSEPKMARSTTSESKKDAKPEGPWKVELTTIGPGRWLTTFGYTFGGFTWDKDERFFSKTVGDAFEVAREERRGGLAYVPTVFFTWISRSRLRRDIAVGPAAGLGFDSANPVPMLGVAGTWRQNVSLVAGALMRKASRLSGSYQVDQSLKDNTTSESLQQSVYRPGLFVSVAFRFGSNPFAGAADSEKPAKTGKTSAGEAKEKDPSTPKEETKDGQ